VFRDLQPGLTTELVPKNWSELLEILSLQQAPWTVCIDEFPYLVAVDSSLPSRLQRFLDHQLPSGCLLILAGSSTAMMHATFLHRSAPLYGRARKVVHVEPMDYAAFCRACEFDRSDPAAFERFACVGGIPKYWEFVDPESDVVKLAGALYFDYASYMEQEPHRALRDEGIAGFNAIALLEAVGRGAERPSEIASRMGTRQTNLSRLLQQLLDGSILTREMPYGESIRSTKRVLYRIQDPATRFWFRVYSPHQSRWAGYPAAHKRQLIHTHAAGVFEDFCRARVPESGRYWERGVELDLVGPLPSDPEALLVAEIKWRRVSAAERRRLLSTLEAKWARTAIASRYARVRFDVIDAQTLAR
jgi:uncharacterized protein